MRRIRVILAMAVTIVAVVLVFAFPAMAQSPRGLIGEGRTDIKEGHHFVEDGQALLGLGLPQDEREVKRGNQAIREGRADIRQGHALLRRG
jgi:hypothetical protein